MLEPIAGYLRLAEKLYNEPTLAGAYNFGPPTHEAATVQEVIQIAQSVYGNGQVQWGDGAEGPHETGWLALEVSKARNMLGVQACWTLAQAVQRTIHWYRQQHDGANAKALCEADIAAYNVTQSSDKSS